MKRFLMPFLMIGFVTSCTFTLPTPNDETVQPTDAERATASEVWQALSRAVDANQIMSLQRLTQYVVVLARNGEISAKDVAIFDAAFPNAAKHDRPLTHDDVLTLRKLKAAPE